MARSTAAAARVRGSHEHLEVLACRARHCSGGAARHARRLVAQSMSATVEMTNDDVPTCTHPRLLSGPVGNADTKHGGPYPWFARGAAPR
jgi:hypothetical protein